jgi:uncharacterized protein (TIGR00299 family) protein
LTRTAYFDCYNGISGDMTLGALVDLGLPLDDLRAALATLPVSGYELTAERITRCGVGATLVRVRTAEHHHHRGLGDIEGLIAESRLPDVVKERAVAVFRRLAEAEATVHSIPVEHVHFHEVGALDAIVDIVGACWGLHALGIGRVIGSPVAVGAGTVRTAHGELPVPAPATAVLLLGVPTHSGPMSGELATPTGAALLTSLAESFGPQPLMTIVKVGYGAGSRETAGHTNFLRIMLGEIHDSAALPVERRDLRVVQTEIDDMSPEIAGHILDRLFETGCLDAHLAPVQMKKNRPGISVRVLVEPERLDAIITVLLRETSTFGVRVQSCDRYALPRRIEQVATPFGAVDVKIGYWGGDAIKFSPEYESCRRVARECGVPLGDVYLAASEAARRCGESQ